MFVASSLGSHGCVGREREKRAWKTLNMYAHTLPTHPQNVCLDTMFPINMVDIWEKAADIQFLKLTTCSTTSDARGETTNTMQQLRTFLHTSHILVAPNRLPITSGKTNRSVVTGSH